VSAELRCRVCGGLISKWEEKQALEWCSGYYLKHKGGGGHGWKARVRHNEWAHKDCAQKEEDGRLGQESML
jgi:hypothetical protein